MKSTQKIYGALTNIHDQILEEKSVIVIGSGFMARQFCIALNAFKIKNVTIISKSEKNAKKLANEFNYFFEWGGYEKIIPTMKKVDLVIIATPVFDLLPAAKLSIDSGQNNILIEKPGSLYLQPLIEFNKILKLQNVRIGYNRFVYPNLYKLKQLIENDGGITSCTFEFTEWLNSIDFQKDLPDVFSRLGISNSLHPISMAFNLIGMPKKISTFQIGSFDWHSSGSTFTGSGISKNNIPFSYHADWNSKGRWGIIIYTKNNIYRLIPLEKLYVFSNNDDSWKPIPFDLSFPSVKQGIAEEIAIMLDKKLQNIIDLPTLSDVIEFNLMAEKIFNY